MYRDSLGNVRARHGAAAYEYWRPFSVAFGEVVVLARVDPLGGPDDGALVEGDGVTVLDLPYYRGLAQIPGGIRRVRKALSKIGQSSDLFVVRLPELIGLEVHRRALKLGARTVSFLVSDPTQGLKTLLPRGAKNLGALTLAATVRRRMIRSSAGVYVSQAFLQKRYPVSVGTPTLARSNVIFGADWLAEPQSRSMPKGSFRLVSVGTLEHRGKGFDFIFKVMELLRKQGHILELDIVGSGRLMEALRVEAERKGVRVRFLGQVEDRKVLREILDEADIYVSGSRFEGLPRATVEAMVRGLPVVTTDAGAARELVDDDAVAPIDDVSKFAAILERLMADADWFSHTGTVNRLTAIHLAELAHPQRLIHFLANLADTAVQHPSVRIGVDGNETFPIVGD